MSLYNNLLKKFSSNFIGAAAMSILVQSCLGGAAAMAVLAKGTSAIQITQLALVVFISMLANTSILAQMKHQFIFNAVVASLLVSSLIIFINL